jgi:hypothetical protein
VEHEAKKKQLEKERRSGGKGIRKREEAGKKVNQRIYLFDFFSSSSLTLIAFFPAFLH